MVLIITLSSLRTGRVTKPSSVRLDATNAARLRATRFSDAPIALCRTAHYSQSHCCLHAGAASESQPPSTIQVARSTSRLIR